MVFAWLGRTKRMENAVQFFVKQSVIRAVLSMSGVQNSVFYCVFVEF